MNGLLRNQPPVVMVVVAFLVGMGLAYVGEHFLGLDRRSGDFSVGLITGGALGAAFNRPKATRSPSTSPPVNGPRKSSAS